LAPTARYCGTLTFGSPEIVGRTGHLTAASDIWGLGVILYALVYATLPFGDKPVCRERICAGRFEFDDDKPTSEEYRALVSAILCVNPARRATIEQIRAHPWLAAKSATQKVCIISSALQHTDDDGKAADKPK
jgi:serine/threonine protein kinase